MSSPQYSNRLSQETSLYLRQHQHNPVDWFPWGEEALAKAQAEDKPIFLSIGYSACHWCHVMEHESFENESIAAFLNEHFVSIKVDREERPDLDQIYMTAIQLLNNGQGGWPMSVFLTPDQKPFTGGTYFPPEDKYGRPGFGRILRTVHEWWTTRRGEIEEASTQLTESVSNRTEVPGGAADLDQQLLQRAADVLATTFDPAQGGFGSAPKFPHAMDLRLLLRVWKRFGNEQALHMARFTLEKMSLGGIYDHLGGGFARYSTDARWLVPHFEKMLYDNALLITCCTELFQVTKAPLFREVAVQTIEWVLREMTHEDGPFFSTLDADSEGEEGKFYVWTEAEIRETLGQKAEPFVLAFGVTADGNWEGKTILERKRSNVEVGELLERTPEEIQQSIDEARQVLYQTRVQRVWPGRDEKVLTAWNAMMIDALARASRVFGKPEFAEAATTAAKFILMKMRSKDGRIYRTWSEGGEAKFDAYLEDYAFLCDSMITLYEATFEPVWIRAATSLAGVMVEQFWDEDAGGFFFTGKDHEALIARNKELHDNAIPSGNAVAVQALLRLAKLTGNSDYFDQAERTLRLSSPLMSQHSLAMAQMLIALDFYIGPTREIVWVGEDDSALDELVSLFFEDFRPNRVLAVRRKNTVAAHLVPLLADKPGSESVSTYLCENFVCHQPVHGLEESKQVLRRV